ncbi:hypothetical protein JG687_00001100 [Phytophthora cactorum]|uniref:Uncharacterized protein n=1 Tax=Phytophthora cactorum TaxID=29920 RepID=A0A8T1UZ32_9STRA|nr:hypothetical protein JG687_00001100 [Phytophthora cactorum]
MKERLAEILALRSVVDALQQEDVVQVLSEVTVLSDEYLPLLKFLMAPDNLTCLISSMLQEPTPTAKATAAAARQPGDPPSYEEYATAFRAHWVLCGSGFSHQLLAAMSALKGEPRALIAQTLAEFNSRDSMALEAFARFITSFMDQYSPQMFMSLFDKTIRQQKTFLESLLLLVFYESLRDVMLSPMNPIQQISDRVSEKLHQRVAKDVETVRFSRMIFTCDLLTDLIHEKREGSLGFAMMTSLSESESNAQQLIDAALHDLLLSFFSSEETSLQWRFKSTHVQLVYLMLPVLNVSCTVADTLVIRTKTLDTLLELITRFPKASILHCAIARLFIVALEDSPFMFGKELPAFRSSTDPLRIHLLLGGALSFVLQSYGWTSVPDDTADGAKKPSPPPAFLDIAISLDQALTSAFAHSSQLFIGNSAFERWKVFRLEVLLPIQTLWEEQYQPPPEADTGPSPTLAVMLYGGEGHNQPHEDIPADAKHHRDRKQSTDGIAPSLSATASANDISAEMLADAKSGEYSSTRSEGKNAQTKHEEGPCVSVLVPQSTSASEASAPALHDVPTPLSALYNEEEKRMMLKVSDDDTVSSSPPIALVIPAAVPQIT